MSAQRKLKFEIRLIKANTQLGSSFTRYLHRHSSRCHEPVTQSGLIYSYPTTLGHGSASSLDGKNTFQHQEQQQEEEEEATNQESD